MKAIETAWYAGKITNDRLIFFSETLHSLYEMDLRTKKIKWLNIVIDRDFIQKSYGIKSMFEYKENLFLWTMCGVGYSKVNLENFTSNCCYLVDNTYTAEIVKENDDSIIIPSEKPWKDMWRFDFENEGFSRVDADITRIKSIIHDSDSVQCAGKIGDMICFPVIQKDYVLIYSISDNRFDYISVPNCSFYGVAGDDNRMYLSQYGTYDIVEYEIKNSSYRIIKNQYGCGTIDMLPAYSRILKQNRYMLSLPCTTEDKIGIFDILTGRWRVLDYPQGYEFNKKKKYLYSFYGFDIESDGKICVFQLSGNMLLEICFDSDKINGFRVTIPYEYSQKITDTITQYGSIPIYEGTEIGLTEFLSIL